MRMMLVGLAASAGAVALAAPAAAQVQGQAQMLTDGGFHAGFDGGFRHSGRVGPGDFRGGDRVFIRRDRDHGGDHDGDRRRRHRGDRDRDGTVFVNDWYGGEWALYNNRSWESDSYNDWWHDRPDRAFPRWVRHNKDCAPDRMWWSGGGWHC